MKLIKLAFGLTLFTCLFSCNTLDRDTNDIVDGTPTNADTVLYQKSEHTGHHTVDYSTASEHREKVFRR